jgi:hypothetical protein
VQAGDLGVGEDARRKRQSSGARPPVKRAARVRRVAGELPDRLPDDWASDPAYELSLDEQTPTRYPTLFRSDFWLPGEFSFTANGRAPNGTEVTFGSSTALIDELLELNARTWRTGEIAEWFAHGKRTEDGLEECAKFAFVVLLAMARFARHDSLPMVLDW